MKFTTEEYVTEVKNCDSMAFAQMLMDYIFSEDSGSEKGPFTPKIPTSWSMFYALKNLEDKFNLPHKSSAYVAVDLMMPKMQSVWASKKVPTSRCDFKEYVTEIYMDLLSYIDKWNPDINDNFLAFALSELSTVANRVGAPEINKYLQTTRGYTSCSLEGLSEVSEGGFEVPDKDTDVEEYVISKIDYEKNSLAHMIIKKESDEITGSMEEVKDAIIAEKLFGGIKNIDKEMFSALEEFCER
jgi:hypothetical protein